MWVALKPTITKQPKHKMIIDILAEVSGKIHIAAAALGVPVGIGLIGLGASQSVGRNPEASTKIMVQSILAMALAEAIIFIAIFLGG